MTIEVSPQRTLHRAGTLAPFVLGDDVLQCLTALHRGVSCSADSSFTYASRSCRFDMRRAEFDAGRACAGSLLRQLGASDTRVLVSADRAPIWPDGFTGSISHSSDLLGVAVARRSPAIRSLGVDIEAIVSEETCREVAAMCVNPVELELIESLDADKRVAMTVLFSAKEALFKALYPLVGGFFDFCDAEVRGMDSRSQRLDVILLRDLSTEFVKGSAIRGSYRSDSARVFTAFRIDTVRSPCAEADVAHVASST